jgi:hypothetical protein
MSLLGKFTKRSNLDPIKKLAEDATRSLERKLENSVEDLFARTLSSTGLSSSITRNLSAKLGDAVKNELVDKYFQTGSSEFNRVSKDDICNNFLPNYAQTASGSVRSIEEDLKNIDGVKGDVLQYPPNMGKYYMSMKFRQYIRQAPQLQSSLRFDNAIILPVPRRLEEEFNLNINSFAQGGYGALADVIQTTSSGAGTDYSPTQAIAFAMMARSLKALESDAADSVSQYLGSIPNPHMAALFQGIDLRKFQFEWTFSPRNVNESIEIQNIVLKLKQNSLPAFSTLGTPILQYPLMCQIEMEPWHTDGADLITFKPALLESVKVNYSPNGIPSFFAGTNLPTFIQLSLNFVETTYFTSNDFGPSDATRQDDAKLNAIVEETNNYLRGVLPEDVVAGVDNLSASFDGILRGDGSSG